MSRSAALIRPTRTRRSTPVVGTIIDFTAGLPAGEWKRGELSAEKTLTFELKDPRSFRQGQALKNGLVELDTRIYASAPDPSKGTQN